MSVIIRENKINQKEDQSGGEPEPIHVPMDIILHLGKYLKFEDYRSFTQSIWPEGDESGIIQNKLWQLSTHKFEAVFFNGKRLEVVYNFDAARGKDDRVLIDSESLTPLFGGIVLPGSDRFKSISELQNLVAIHVHVNLCSEDRYACCPCHLVYDDDDDAYDNFVKPLVDECEEEHFQHYCPQHVISWLHLYLKSLILMRESIDLFNENIAEQYSFFTEDIVYFQTGRRATPEFLLKTALEIDAAIYESDDE